MKSLAYFASGIGLASTLWLAMVFIGANTGSIPIMYVALLHPWVVPIVAAIVVGIVAWVREAA